MERRVTCNGLDGAIERAVNWLLEHQYPEGYWWGELESNVTITAEHLFLTHILGIGSQELWERIGRYILTAQHPEGYWTNWYGGPGELSTTVEAYVALKMGGVDPDDPRMRKAREWIVEQGGVEKTRVFTKIWLALMGEWSWEATPMLLPELVLLPQWFPVNLYSFASWARGTILPLGILRVLKPVFPIRPHARIDELFVRGRDNVNLLLPRKRSAWGRFFYGADKFLRAYERVHMRFLRRRAIQAAEEWIIARQEADGCWGGIQPPWVYSLIALYALGYAPGSPVMAKGLAGFERYAIEDERGFRLQSCISPVWDTGLAAIALHDAGLSPDRPALVKAGEWLVAEQTFVGGDWQVRCTARPGGWAFEFDNDCYPDTDDTAVVMMALVGIDLPAKDKEFALARGLEWLLGMQSKDGGWGAFDRDNTRAFLREIPFADFGEVIDPPSVDVTAHIVECLGRLGCRRGFRPVDRALQYLFRDQERDGSWFGRWGVNHIYGTGAVLQALEAIDFPMDDTRVRRAVDWLLERQNPDGGWGEDVMSYHRDELRGWGRSTASQTAWALLGLLAAGDAESKAVRRGIGYLTKIQRGDGTWDEPYFTGTGFPTDFMIRYHLYRHYFPLMALGRYRKAVIGDE